MEFKKALLRQYLECAKCVNTHGVKGAVKLESYADTPTSLVKLKRFYLKKHGEFIPLKVLSSSIQKNFLLVLFEGVDTVEKAISLKNAVFFADRDDIHVKKGDHFIADLIGLPVVDHETGEEYGVLKEVLAPAAQQVYVVKKENGSEFMIPCVGEFIKKISIGEDSDAAIYVHLIDGMAEDE